MISKLLESNIYIGSIIIFNYIHTNPTNHIQIFLNSVLNPIYFLIFVNFANFIISTIWIIIIIINIY